MLVTLRQINKVADKLEAVIYKDEDIDLDFAYDLG